MWGVDPWGSVTWGGLGGGPTVYHTTISDGVVAEDTLTGTFVAVIRDILLADDTLSARAEVKNALADNVTARDFVLRVLREMISDEVELTDEVTTVYAAISRIVDGLIATGTCTTLLAAKNTIAEHIYVADAMARSFPVAFSEVLELGDTLRTQMAATVTLVDQALAQDTLTPVVAVTVAIADGVEVQDSVSTLLEAFNRIADGVCVVATLMIDGNLYTGVVFNTELGAASEYANWPFNSMTQFENMYVGAKRDGIYIMEGETDDGEEIDSFVRTGLVQIAGGLRSRGPDAYFIIAAKGIDGAKPRMLIKAITSENDGTKHEFWYEMEHRGGDAPIGNRVKFGRGLDAVTWQFEARSIDGTMFNLNEWKVHPMALQRRTK